MSTSVALRRLLLATATVVAVVVAAVAAGAARADDPPPLISVGPVSDPNNAVTASGTASSQTGKTDACVNQQHSGTAAPPADAQNGVQVNDSSCQTSTSTATTGGADNATGSSSGAGGRTVSSSKGSSQAGTASAKRSRSSATAAVAAAQAQGLRTPTIRYLTTAVPASGKLRLLVTVRDLRGRLVRDANVSIRGFPGVKVACQVATIASTQATLSNRRGQAGFVVRVPKQSLGKRLLLLVAARTPKANALALGSVRLPGAAKLHA